MIHEWREYTIAPGKSADLHKRFEEVTEPLFKKHGIKALGYWNVVFGENPKLVYLCEFEDLPHRERAWASFFSDPEWIAGRAASEKNGALTLSVVNTILSPTKYSAIQ